MTAPADPPAFAGDQQPDRVDELIGALRRTEAAHAEAVAELKASAQARRRLEAETANARSQAKRLGWRDKALVRQLKAARQQISRGERELRRAERDLERLARSRAWRLGSGLSDLDERIRRRRTRRDPVEEVRRHLANVRERLRGGPSTDATAPRNGSAPSKPPQPAGSAEPRPIGPPAEPIPPTRPGPARPVVVIPVHDGLEHLEACLGSVLAHTREDVPVIVVDDASPDSRVRALLSDLAAQHRRIETVVNERNLGYTASINRGCRRAGEDVVLLNSDTIVTEGWLDKLTRVAYSRPGVATVTPVSNAAGAFSVPDRGSNEPLPSHISREEMARLVERLSDKMRPRAPTGNGFCMYVRRAALDAVGPFDEQSFPRGYGEENDFCMRAGAAGFVHLIDDATFIEHAGAGSFGAQKEALLRSARGRLAELHPAYKPAVTRFLAADALGPLRDDLRAVLDGGRHRVEVALGAKPCLLFVLHAGEGGVPQTNSDLVASASNQYRCLVLHCDRRAWRLCDHDLGGSIVEELTFDEEWRAQDPLSPDRLDALRGLCRRHDVVLAHVRSLIASGPEILSALREDRVPTVLSLHDFYTVCPTIQLVDHDLRYCAGHCTPGEGHCPTSKHWLPGLPPLKHRYVHPWRARMAEHMGGCDAFVVTSASSAATLADHFEFLDGPRLHVIPHGRDQLDYEPVGMPPGEGPVRVACLGAHSLSKGVAFIEAVLRADAEHNRFEFHMLGAKHGRFSLETLGAEMHGPYRRAELPRLLGGIRPSFVLIPSLWPETWSHTLSEAWMAGVPVLASGLGALRERIEEQGGGWLIDHADPAGTYRQMLALADDPAEWWRRRTEIGNMAPRTVDDMALDYRMLYRSLLEVRAAEVAPAQRDRVSHQTSISS